MNLSQSQSRGKAQAQTRAQPSSTSSNTKSGKGKTGPESAGSVDSSGASYSTALSQGKGANKRRGSNANASDTVPIRGDDSGVVNSCGPVPGTEELSDDQTSNSGASSGNTCGACLATLPSGQNMVQCDRCELWLCLICADVSEGLYNTLADYHDLIWCCPSCKQKALSAMKSDWDIESRCSAYLETVTTRIDALEKSIDTKVDRNDITPIVKASMEEVVAKEKRKRSLVVFNLQEAQVSSNLKVDRDKVDLEAFLQVCNSVCERKFVGSDVKSVTRLGKKSDQPRPLLVELSHGPLKGEIFKCLPKLASHPDESLHAVRMKHDMTKDERAKAKQLFELAKAQEADDGGKFRYRVRGPPWDMKIVKYQKQIQ